MEKNNVLAVPAKALRFQPNEAFLKKGEKIDDCEGDHKLWTKEGNVFKAHKVETGTSNGVMTEITGGIAAGTEVLTDFIISGGEMTMPEQQAGNPFMPRPRNNNNNNRSGQSGNAAPPRQ
jgi:HlyD family secretion protein